MTGCLCARGACWLGLPPAGTLRGQRVPVIGHVTARPFGETVNSMTAQAPHLLLLPVTRIAVVLVDFQNDFCSPAGAAVGPPTNTRNEAAARRANAFAAEASRLGAHIIYTQQVLDWEVLSGELLRRSPL